MCELLCRQYRGLGQYVLGIQRCPASFSRPDKAYCTPPSGKLRDLERVVDAQDDHYPGRCPTCTGQTPPSSEGSEKGWVI